MLLLTSLGGSSVSLSDGKTTVVAFPKKPVTNAVNLLSQPEEDPKGTAISWPGEYDIGGIAIRGIGQQEGQHVSYTMLIDDVRVALPSSPLEDWSQADIEHLGDVHILVLPAESPKLAQSLIEEIDPRMIVIVAGSDGTMHPDVLKHAGATGKEPVAEYKLKGGLSVEGREVIVLAA